MWVINSLLCHFTYISVKYPGVYSECFQDILAQYNLVWRIFQARDWYQEQNKHV